MDNSMGFQQYLVGNGFIRKIVNSWGLNVHQEQGSKRVPGEVKVTIDAYHYIRGRLRCEGGTVVLHSE